MHPTPKQSLLIVAVAAVVAVVAACATAPRPSPATAPATGPAPSPTPAATPNTVPPPAVGPAAAPAPAAAAPPAPKVRTISNATNPKAYRRDAASHLYASNAERIYKGMLKPHLYAIGVLDVDINRQGEVTAINWLRAPRHAPEVMAEIIRTVRAAAPYPIPTRMGRVTYTETWLWDKSGKFQLDTLTEGQL